MQQLLCILPSMQDPGTTQHIVSLWLRAPGLCVERLRAGPGRDCCAGSDTCIPVHHPGQAVAGDVDLQPSAGNRTHSRLLPPGQRWIQQVPLGCRVQQGIHHLDRLFSEPKALADLSQGDPVSELEPGQVTISRARLLSGLSSQALAAWAAWVSSHRQALPPVPSTTQLLLAYPPPKVPAVCPLRSKTESAVALI